VMFTVNRLVRINQVVRCKVIRETRFKTRFIICDIKGRLEIGR